jgi:RND family efflux transporter MFP subunit
MRNKYNFLWLIALVVVILFSGCGKKAEEQAVPPMVKTQIVSLGSGAETSTYSGEVRGRYESNLAFQVGGKIIARNVQLGSRVKAGDILMTLDAKDVAQSVNMSAAQVEAARAKLNLAQANLARYQQLYNEAAISASTIDQYQTSYDGAVADYQQAQAQYAQNSNSLGYTDLIADSDGVISALTGEVGQVVASGQSVLTLIKTNELEVEINVPENRVQDMSVGKDVTVGFWAMNNLQLQGKVREVSPMADSVARTYKVRISLLEPLESIQLGMTASVNAANATGTDSNYLYLLPLSAIYQTGTQPQVWVVGDDSLVHLTDITVESFGDNQVKVTSGLKNKDVVVIAGVHKLRDNQEVRVMTGDEQ